MTLHGDAHRFDRRSMPARASRVASRLVARRILSRGRGRVAVAVAARARAASRYANVTACAPDLPRGARRPARSSGAPPSPRL
ncbi:hypothetical protein WS72_24965 [Burkholderia savannae]|uniref:Uncharacterized protein n=1 Tax=Burkholderia savannae TaxID=1637837 RepID=A0ABR5T4M5_9BURK|nr:hypothetical protein WS72_24965 [Burkholderia savannae]